jgi:subtilisin family serine protease
MTVVLLPDIPQHYETVSDNFDGNIFGSVVGMEKSPHVRARNVVLVGLFVIGSIAVNPSVASSVAVPVSRPTLPILEASTSRYIVRFAEGASTNDIADLVDDAKRRGRTVRRGQGKAVRQAQLSKVFNGGVYDLSSDVVAELTSRIAARDSRLVWLEPDVEMRVVPQRRVGASAAQSSAPWGLDRIDQAGLPLNGTYDYGTMGAGVSVYVVDTGILAAHNDIAGRVRAGYDAIGDGRNSSDCNGHGTHVAGTIGGTTYGVAKLASLVAVRVLDCSGAGSLSGVIVGVDWSIEDHVSGPAVMNLSLGGGASSSLDAAIDRAYADGISVVVAAGNSNVDACTSSPARAKNAITVGATTSSDARASYSNFGTCLDIFAPGSAILSSDIASNTATATLSGTSMATPHVAGVAARILGANPTLLPDQVTSTIVATATPNKVTAAGTGSPNRLLYVAPDVPVTTTTTLAPSTTVASGESSTSTTAPASTTTTTMPFKAPAPPVNVRAIGGNLSVVVSWSDGTPDSGLVHDHTIYVYRSGRLEKSVIVGDIPETVIDGLKANQKYTFRITARNAIGPSDLSAPSNEVIPFSANVKRADLVTTPDPSTGTPSDSPDASPNIAPTPARGLSAKLRGSTVVVSWAAKGAGATGTEFTVIVRFRGRIISRIPVGPTTRLTLRGIRSTTLYSYRVIAENGTGGLVRSDIVRATR